MTAVTVCGARLLARDEIAVAASIVTNKRPIWSSALLGGIAGKSCSEDGTSRVEKKKLQLLLW